MVLERACADETFGAGTGGLERGGAHRHPSVHADDEDVQRQAGDDEPHGREATVDPSERTEERVGADEHDRAHRLAHAAGERDPLEREARQRNAPPMDPETFERSEASARGEPDAHGHADHDENEHHAGKSPTRTVSRPIVPRGLGGVQRVTGATLGV